MKFINFLLIVLLFLLCFFISYQIINTKKEIYDVESRINKLKEENENLKLIREKLLSKIKIESSIDEKGLNDIESKDIIIIETK